MISPLKHPRLIILAFFGLMSPSNSRPILQYVLPLLLNLSGPLVAVFLSSLGH